MYNVQVCYLAISTITQYTPTYFSHLMAMCLYPNTQSAARMRSIIAHLRYLAFQKFHPDQNPSRISKNRSYLFLVQRLDLFPK